jgi:16S rRNA (uracil1498-N3)-methyltransferase
MSTKGAHTLPRFLVQRLGDEGDQAVLSAGESHHLARVLRLRPGDRVSVFDGRGREFVARIVQADRAAATVSLVARVENSLEPRVPFSLVQSLLKGPAMDEVIRDATMMGASSIEPVLTSHVAVKSPLQSTSALLDRWQRVALASAKQCRRAVLPVVHRPRRFEEWLASTEHALRLLFVEPSADLPARPLRAFVGAAQPATAALIVGPEGGWSPDELEAALSAGCVPVTLGRLTLRADAVALTAAALFRFVWDD